MEGSSSFRGLFWDRLKPPQSVQARLSSARLGPARPRSDRRGLGNSAGLGSGLARVLPGLNLILVSWAWLGSAPLGSAQRALPQPRFGLAQPGLAHIGSAWLNSTRSEDVSDFWFLLFRGGWLEREKLYNVL